ncbi:hypothetical protein, partial [Vagococcus sp.]|uniref:hypothetical protein n=1 Tax=Vagococcus sp. TaxID=1933889 RepID=UPI002FC8BA80
MLTISIQGFIFVRIIEICTFLMVFYFFLKQKNLKRTLLSSIICLAIELITSAWGIYSYIFIFIVLFVFNYSKGVHKICLSFLFSVICIYFQGILFSLIYIFISETNMIKNEIFLIVTYSISFIMAAILMSLLLSFSYKNYIKIIKNHTDEYQHRYRASVILFILIISLFAVFIYIQKNHIHTIQNNNKFVLLFVITSLSLLLINKIILTKIKNNFIRKEEQKELKQLISYTKKLEENQKQLRKFKHDYLNILLSLQSPINNEDIHQIKQVFNTIHSYSKETLNNYESNTSDLSNILVLPIKSIFLSKFLNWKENVLPYVSFECISPISHFFVDDIVLVRILGNLLDNAYEEILLQDSPDKFINIAVI